MREHVHTGGFVFLYTGLSAWLFLNILRFVAIWADGKPQLEWLARAIGGSINFANAGANA